MTTVFTSFDAVTKEMTKGVFACPTDTLYGLSTSIYAPDSIARIKVLKGKDASMPLIVLIGSFEQIDLFLPDNTPSVLRLAKKLWPGPVSIVFPNVYDTWDAISPNNTVALRMPDHPDLQKFLQRVGPIISTSANKTGYAPKTHPAAIVTEFPEGIDFIVDRGECNNPASTLIKVLR